MSWFNEAACRGSDPDLFFPDRTIGRIPAAAEAFCAGCPVRAECLDYGLQEKSGYWGGMTENQRRKERLRRREERERSAA